MKKIIIFISFLFSIILTQDCDDNMLMYDCVGLGFCNNEPDWGFDCFVYNEFCEDFNSDGIIDAWVGDGWCDDGEWGYDFQCEEYSFDCGDCGDTYDDYNGYCNYLPNQFTFDHNGLTRSYLLYTPESLSPGSPLIFLMHGFTGSASGIYSYSNMNSIADENGFAVCYPDGTIDQNGDRFWNVGYDFHVNQTVDDVSFLSSLAQYLQEEYNLSIENTFASGMSNGAEMSYKLACEAEDIFKAIAPVAGTMFGESWGSCTSSPIPVLEIHGVNDNVTLWEGDMDDTYWGPYPGIEDVIQFWVDSNQCESYENTLLPNMNTVKRRHFDCLDNVEVWLYEVVNGGHDWPNYSSQEIWNFFSQFTTSSGDLNGDGIINVLDIVVTINIILQSEEYNNQADINNDGVINVLDIVLLVGLILGD